MRRGEGGKGRGEGEEGEGGGRVGSEWEYATIRLHRILATVTNCITQYGT